jgi:hypothetical protein
MPMTVGAPLLLALFAVAAAPWVLVLRARYGHLIAIPATAGGAVLALLAVFVISHLLRANYMLVAGIGSVLAAGIGAYLATRTPNVLRRPSRYSVALWCPALLGGLVWIGTVVAAQFLPGASRFGWAMNGDALNNLYYASVISHDHGIALGAAENPVPLPAALIAVASGAGSPSSPGASAALEHELSAFTLVWVILLALTCLGIGVVIASLIPRTSLHSVALVSGLSSLLPLTWFVAGLTIQWGYFNVSVLLPILLGAWLIYLGSDRHPVAALAALLVLSTVILAVWTPLVLLIAALGTALVIRRRESFRRLRGAPLAGVIVGFALALAFIGVATIPTLASQAIALAASGSGYLGFPNLWWPVPLILVLVVVTLLLARRRTSAPVVSGGSAVIVGAALATGLVLAFAGSNGFDAYYPKKLAWILIVLFGAIALSFVFAAITGRVRNSLLAVIVVLALFAATVLPPGTWPELLQRQPIARITGDYVRHEGESTVREIFALANSAHPTILWQSGDPDEPIINEWLLLTHGGLVHGNKKLIATIGGEYFFYRGSGRYVDPNVATLCQTLRQLPGTPTVITSERTLSSRLTSECPTVSARVVVTESLRGSRPSRVGENWQTDGIEGPFY